jgi:hypothetical protein
MNLRFINDYKRAGWEFLASGAYGKVYADPRGQLIVKRAANDGTRTYLEWVIAKTLAGEFMRGMPWIESLRSVGSGHYIVVMRRYERKAYAWWDDQSITFERYESGTPKYLRDLNDAFVEATGGHMGDLGPANVLWDAETQTAVITDPSGGSYSRSSYPDQV